MFHIKRLGWPLLIGIIVSPNSKVWSVKQQVTRLPANASLQMVVPESYDITVVSLVELEMGEVLINLPLMAFIIIAPVVII